MSDHRQAPGYSGSVQALHWIGAAVIIAAWALGVSMDLFPRGAARSAAMNVHSTLGLMVFSLAVLRILWRTATSDPPHEGPEWMVPLANAGHVALYALTVAIPVLGLLARWSHSGTATLIGGLAIPAPFPLAETHLWGNVHAFLAYALSALVGLHVAAALIHHVVLRDNILRRMLPIPRG